MKSREGQPAGKPEGKPKFGARTFRIIGIVAVIVAVLMVVAAVWALVATATPEFFSRYHLLNRRYVNLEGSAHKDIGCRACHETQPVANGVALVGEYYASLVKTGKTPRYFKFGPPTNEACLKCHMQDWSDEASRTARIPHPAHTRVASEERPCVECHKWTAHLETYMDKHKEMPFSGVCVAYGCHVGIKQTEQCFDCHHVLHESGDQWRTEHPKTVATSGENACLESCHEVDQCQQCHTTGKRPEFDGRPIEVGMKAIEELHVKPEWTERYHGTEALKDRAKCLKCHQSQGECDECHRNRPDFHGQVLTWIGRHSKVATDVIDPRCIECHEKPFCEDCHEQFEEMG